MARGRFVRMPVGRLAVIPVCATPPPAVDTGLRPGAIPGPRSRLRRPERTEDRRFWPKPFAAGLNVRKPGGHPRRRRFPPDSRRRRGVEPGEGPAAPETPETVTRLNGDAVEGWQVGAVAADEEEDDDGGSYTCFDSKDCWEKCPLKSQDGSSVSCECSKNKNGSGWTCDVKTGFLDEGGGGGEGEGGGTCGGNGGGTIGTGGLEKCQEVKMPVEMTCESGAIRGEKRKCEAKPLIPSHDTRKTQYAWSAECFLVTASGSGNQCEATREGKGRRYQTWSGRASTHATIKVRITAQPNDSTLYVGGASRDVKVFGRYWTTGHLVSTAGMEYPENPPRGGAWRKGSWGAFGKKISRSTTASTKSGSGPWAGTHYLKKEPDSRLLWDFLYVHPDLTYSGPLYPGAETVCGDDSPDIPDADLERVNWDCGTESEWSLLKTRVESHERAHQRSYNRCVTGGLSYPYMYLLEGLAGKKSAWREEVNEIWKDMWEALDAAASTPQKEPPTPVMWHYRYPNNNWNLDSHKLGHHNGTWGC